MAWSQDPYQQGATAGTEVSGPGGGRKVTLLESLMTHPSHTDGFVDKGDPVVVGNIVGVACRSADAATEYVPVDTEGIWNLTVAATDHVGNLAVSIGDRLYVTTTAPALSRDHNGNTARFFGYALGAIAAAGESVIPVKVHNDPMEVDSVLVGTGAARFTSAVADTKFLEHRFECSYAGGDNRGHYLRLYLTGIGGGGEALCAFTTVENVAGGTAHGGHISLNFGATGSITGLGAAMRATLHIPNAALTGGTYCGGMSELYYDGSSSDISGTTKHSIHRFVQDGNATGKATATTVFEFVGLSDNQFDDVGTATPSATLRCVINGNVRYLLFADSAAA